MESGLQYFFPGECYQKVVLDYSLDGDCIKLLYSRFLSMQIILGALIVKVPQIIKILRAGSVENLSYLAFYLELAAVTFTCTYNSAKGFSFSTWGESLFIAVQVVVLLGLMYHYNGQIAYLTLFIPAYAALVWYLTSDLVTMDILSMLQASVIPLLLISRLSQVVTTFVNKTTGQLSLVTCLLNWLGTAARVFTTLQETQDLLMLVNYASSFAVNSVIMLQFGVYWNAKSIKEKTS